MSITVNTNVQSLFAQRALSKNTLSLQKSIEKLSTGSKINKAADDAAGLGISEKLTAQIRGLEKAQQNVGDGISMVQTAEGSLSIVHDNLQRIRELVVQAKNGTNGDDELNSIQSEINKRVETIDSVAKSTKFNDKGLLATVDSSNAITGAAQDISLQVGANDSDTLDISLSKMYVDVDSDAADGISNDGTTKNIALNTLHVGGTTKAFDGTTATATGDLDDIDGMIKNVSRMRSDLGAIQNSLESRSEFLGVAIENNSSSRSRVKDVDVARESSSMLKNQILQQSAASMLSQANSTPQLALNLLP
jgi:flagellin